MIDARSQNTMGKARNVWSMGKLGMTLALALALLVLASPAVRADAGMAPKKIVSLEGITEYHLDNGLRVLLFPDPSSPNVTVNLTLFVGSRHEGYGETGMAHLLEHMVFKGTPSHPDVPKALNEHGGRFNGTTWVDRTNYFETMPGTDKNLEFAIRLEADRMVNSYIKKTDLDTEMTVVRSEFERGENSPDRILSQRMSAAAYEWHNYGKSTIGNRSDIERVPIEKLQAFYRKYYQPDNAQLVVAGKFDPAKALAYVTKYFGRLKRPDRKLDSTYTEEPTQDGERSVNLRRVGKVGIVGLVYHIPAAAHPDFAAMQVLNSILVSEPSGRLYQALVPTKLANSISGMAFAFHDPGILEISAQVDPKQSLPAVRDAMVKLMEGLGKSKITSEEVDRAKSQFKRDHDLLMGNSNDIGMHLNEWAAKGDWRLFFLHRDRMAKVTPADVARVAEQYLKPSNRTLGMFIPTEPKLIARAEVPATPDVAALVKDYKGVAAVTAGEDFDTSPENIDKRTQRLLPKTGPQAAFLAKKNRGETVTLLATLRFGNDKSLKGLNNAARFLGTMLTRGTKKHTRQQLQDELSKLGARLSAQSDTGSLTLLAKTSRKNLPGVIALLTEILEQPSFPPEEFDILKREQLDELKKGLTEPMVLAQRALQRQLSPHPKDDVRYVPTQEEQIARVEATTLDQVKQLYQKQLGGGHATFTIVGDFDGKAIDREPLVLPLNLLRKWKAGVGYQRIERPAQTQVKGTKVEIQTPDKPNATFIAGFTLPLTDADPDYAALEIGNHLFGGGSLSSRLANLVRQKKGLSYTVGSHFTADSKDKSARFFVYAICNPLNIDKVDKAVADELARLLKDGVEAKELADAKAAWLEKAKVQRSSDVAMASLLNEGLIDGRTMAYYSDLEKKVAALTVDQVNAAIRKHIDPKRLVIVRAGDFKKKPEAGKVKEDTAPKP